MSDSIDSTKPNVCPVCGAVLSDAAGGLCPRCLLADAAQATQAPGTAPGGEPPSQAEVTAAFPQFEIIQLIGVGGMGTVWRARQPKLGRHVALKLLPASLAERDPAFAERFEREGQLLARLHHPNIVAVHDSGRAGNFFYLVMEFVDGVNLRQAMRASRFTPAQALAIVPKICDALQYAHEEGVLHRDIKPENILLDVKGRVKLVDFGIAKLVAQPEAVPVGAVAPGVPLSSGGSLTLGDAALGTPNYMAPEQIEKPADVDHRADIYSLGVVFYELLTGELPQGEFAPPSEKSAADPRLDGIVQQALEKERARRQQSVGEMRTQVETIAGSPGGAQLKPGIDENPPSKRRFSRTVVVGLLLTLLALGWLVFHSRESVPAQAYKLVQSGNAAVPSAEQSPAKPERVLYFPADRSLGQIFIGPARRDHDIEQIWDDWQRFAEARGKVEIPGGKDVRLDVSTEGVKDLSPLAALQPGDLQALKLTDTSTDECLKHVGKLSGLKYLSIAGENVTDTGLAYCAGLTGMIYLDASGTKITDQSLKVIGRLPRLEVLQLGHTGVTDQGLAELVGLTFLQSLELDQTAVTDHAWTPLLRFRELRYLTLSRTGIIGARLEELGRLPKLEWLDLDGTAVADQSLSALKKITRLELLRLSDTEVTDAGLAALSDIKTLEELTLPTRITDEGIRRLNGLPSLHRLDLFNTATTGKCLGLLDNLPSLRELVLGWEIEDADLVNLKNFPNLEDLSLAGPMTDKGLQFLTVLKSLKTLRVQNSKVTDAGYSVLEKLPALEELHLPEIGDEGLRHVGNVPTLKMLDLSFNPHITDKGLSYLEHLPALEELTLNETHVHGEGLSALRKIRTLKRINMFQTELSPAGVDTLATLTSVEDLRLIGIKIAPKDLLRLQALIPASKMEISLAREEVPPKTLKAGDAAPDFSVQTLDGKTFRLADQRGKTVFLHFWAMWCAPCVACAPDLKKFEAELRAANPNFTMLSLDMDEIDARVRTHVTKHGLDWPQAVIGSGNKITNDFGVAGAPTYFVIGPDGRIVSLSRDWKEIRAAVSSIGGGRAKVNPE